jgi:hypothetical protein
MGIWIPQYLRETSKRVSNLRGFKQGGSNMTGTNCDLFTHKSSRSYLNHLVHAHFVAMAVLNCLNTYLFYPRCFQHCLKNTDEKEQSITTIWMNEFSSSLLYIPAGFGFYPSSGIYKVLGERVPTYNTTICNTKYSCDSVYNRMLLNVVVIDCISISQWDITP